MFSKLDIKWLSNIFPPIEKSGDSIPPLITLESGSAFLRSRWIRNQLRKIIFSDVSTDRFDVNRLALDFGIRPDFLSNLLPENPENSGWILAQSGQLITRSQYGTHLKALQTRSQEAPIPRFSFINEYGISNEILSRFLGEFNNLERQQSTQPTLNAVLEEFDGPDSSLIYSRAYRKGLEAEVLKVCQEADRPHVLDPTSFQGGPPLDFFYGIVESIANTYSKDSVPDVQCQGTTVVYTPFSYLTQQRNDLVDKLREGTVDWVAVGDLEGLQSTTSGTRQYLEEQLGDSALVLRDYVISNEHMKQRVVAAIADLDSSGYAPVRPPNQSKSATPELNLSKKDSNTFSTVIMKMIMVERDPSSNSPKLQLIGDIIVEDGFLEDLTSDLIQRAKLQARASWQMPEHPGFEWQVLLHDKEVEFPNLIPFLRQVVIDNDLKKSTRDAFTAETQKLKQEADRQFQTLWHHRLMAKLNLYQAALEALTDGKLRDELRASLETHLRQNLLPDVLQKAEKRGMIRDKAMRRNVDSLNAFLVSSRTSRGDFETSFADLIAALETFARKQKIDRLSEGELELKKESQVNEMVKSMREDNDPPRLFLTLVVILLSTKGPGVVYATGKFAPRLLKQLRGTMDAEQFGALETVKDAVKGGKLASDQKAFIISIAESAIERVH